MGDEFRPIDASLDQESTQTIELTELFGRKSLLQAASM